MSDGSTADESALDAPLRYVITGAASGMGLAVAESIRAQGHTVIGVDQRDADVVADLSTPDGRRAAIAAILELSGGMLAGAVAAIEAENDSAVEARAVLAAILSSRAPSTSAIACCSGKDGAGI